MQDDTANTTNGVSRQEMNVSNVGSNVLLQTSYYDIEAHFAGFHANDLLKSRETDLTGANSADSDSAVAGSTASGNMPIEIDESAKALFSQQMQVETMNLFLGNQKDLPDSVRNKSGKNEQSLNGTERQEV